jgi:hypothetical protein
MSKRVKIAHEEGLVYPNVWDDFDWIREHRAELYEKYGSAVLLVYEKAVVGVGKDIQSAEANAENSLPPDSKEITPVLYFLSHPYSILRLHRIDNKDEA